MLPAPAPLQCVPTCFFVCLLGMPFALDAYIAAVISVTVAVLHTTNPAFPMAAVRVGKGLGSGKGPRLSVMPGHAHKCFSMWRRSSNKQFGLMTCQRAKNTCPPAGGSPQCRSVPPCSVGHDPELL